MVNTSEKLLVSPANRALEAEAKFYNSAERGLLILERIARENSVQQFKLHTGKGRSSFGLRPAGSDRTLAARAGSRQPPSGLLGPRGPLFPRGAAARPPRFLPRCPGPERPCFAFRARERGEGLTRPRLTGLLTRGAVAGPASPRKDPRLLSPGPSGASDGPQASGRASGAAGPRLRLPPGPGLTSLNGAGETPAPVGSGLRAGAVARADASWRARGGGAERQRSRPRGGGGDPPGYVAAIAAAARPLPTRPPTRPLAAGSCAAAFPRSDGERQCVLAPHARCVSPRGHSCSPAPRRAAPESVVAAAGKGCGPAALTRRHGPGLDAPVPQQPCFTDKKRLRNIQIARKVTQSRYFICGKTLQASVWWVLRCKKTTLELQTSICGLPKHMSIVSASQPDLTM
ncbi:collagen alpha-2(I) chain-like [Rattus rattus]|uniref:collagen alpha-2(I) chain-like n=1 Tax=Rattus rattus TaxID=10117 RepID=UPI0013F38328|nr:collagen alpha-2(I) chain-like [Rattus rattus]